MSEIVLKHEAQKRGLKHYFTGHPCSNGHVCNRTVKGCKCVECRHISYIEKSDKNKTSIVDFRVYRHYFDFDTNNNYIGFTNLSMEDRLDKHIVNAFYIRKGETEYAYDTYFYRSIRKYGVKSIRSELLVDKIFSEAEAKLLESYYICIFDSYKNGMNMTLYGGGGNICSQLTPERYAEYINKTSQASYGMRNPNASGLTDDQILEKAYNYAIENKIFLISQWKKYCKTINYPQYYSKFRFNNEGFNGLIKRLKEKLGDKVNDIQFIYIRTQQHCANISINHGSKK